MQGTNSFQVELVNDNIFEWYVTIEGAKGSFYEVIDWLLSKNTASARC
jgi:hypothetical protein